MASLNGQVPILSLINERTVTITITGMTRLYVRWWFAKHLFVLAARVAGAGLRCNVETKA